MTGSCDPHVFQVASHSQKTYPLNGISFCHSEFEISVEFHVMEVVEIKS